MSQAQLAARWSRCCGWRCSRSALGVVYGKQEARNRFNELQKLTNAARRPRHRVGPAAARAEHLGHARPRRAGRARRPAHGHAAGVRPAHRAAMKHGSSLRDQHAATRPRPRSAAGACWLVGALLTLCGVALLARAVYLQVIDQDFLAKQGDARILRDVEAVGEPRHDPRPQRRAARGQHAGRHGLGRPAQARAAPAGFRRGSPRRSTATRSGSRAASPATSTASSSTSCATCARPTPRKVKALGIPGVDTLREYRRYYPAGEVTGHLLGFTNVDDVGQEGLELAFDQWLGGEPGVKRVMRDRLGRTIEDIERIKAPRPGQDLRTSIDLRVQYLAYRELKAAVQAEPRARRLGRRARHRRPAKCWPWSTSRRSTRTTASSTCRRAIATARPTTSSSRARASSRSSSPPAWRPAASTRTR